MSVDRSKSFDPIPTRFPCIALQRCYDDDNEPGWMVKFIVAQQSFSVGLPRQSREDAEWYAEQLHKALTKYRTLGE